MHGGTVDASDAQLISAVAEGDKHAFELLYHSYFPRLTRFLQGMTRNAQLIEEIVNDTMLVVWNKAYSFDRTCKPSTWVFAIAYRTACKAVRALDEPVEADPGLLEACTEDGPEHELGRHRLRHAVGAALEHLPVAQATVVRLAYHHDMGYADIAAVLDCPVNTVKTRMFHARQRLKELLAGYLEEKV
ncbi:sigma-70 family RNA polymerase sigma factor [Massilia sp. RP-1-19]|uniref:Sigma-70 family RNA polymerase sigma factor n=1 Tax=Massilia polaris TaxID=2728846 RepID=A0A848HNP7_9BURK|nr:sigma-70 family RNA polymerase sigma factor [Massilia polaris]NML62975.1 sigma-70 family RNA polymerase sigma factor [Massilia polaris]